MAASIEARLLVTLKGQGIAGYAGTMPGQFHIMSAGTRRDAAPTPDGACNLVRLPWLGQAWSGMP